MSGGVDSSVAAALLKDAGHDVIGMTMHLAGSDSRCCSLDDADDARRVADKLGIRFYVGNYKDQFREEVTLPFADAYLAGRTPIPCVTCNKRFKFDHLLERARALGADAVATGHYARLVRSDVGPTLHRGRDRSKDQSYFLFNLSSEQLRHIQFPLGELTKEEVRDVARGLGLATAEKPESQEICFVPDGDYARVVEQLRPEALPGQGEVVDEAGQVLGRHEGIHRFTVGQRKGLALSGGQKRYVVAIDAEQNRVVVGDEAALGSTETRVEAVSWTFDPAPSAPLRGSVQIRHQHGGASATIAPDGARSAVVRFDEPVRAVAPGQAAVFFDGDRVLGGGWIAGAIRPSASSERATDPAGAGVAQ
jgi:tRNA-specific 2-thiouridylase